MSRAAANLAVSMLFFAAACAGTDQKPATASSAGGSAHGDRISPLGLGQPDPERIFERALRAFDANDAWGFLGEFAFMGQDGKYFVPAPRDGDAAPDLAGYGDLADGLRQFLSSDYANVRYHTPVNVRNVPPTVEVILSVAYDFTRVAPERRAEILDSVNALLARRYGPSHRPMTWEEWERQLLNAPRDSRRRFVHVNGDWRFDAAWVVRD